MGVTIHFEGQLTDQVTFQKLIEAAVEFARHLGWKTELIDSDQRTLSRVRDEKELNYVGPVYGVALYPHADCDPVRLEFDHDLYIREFTKTQFAGISTHLSILRLLKAVRPYFRNLKVEDESEYWETEDVRVLGEHFSRNQEAIDAELRKDPSARMKVKTPEGRILDILS